MFLWSFFLAPSFLVHMARVKPYFKTPYICPLRLLSNLSPLCYFIQLCKIFAVESRIICKNLYIFCYCCWAQNWRLSFHLFKAKKLYRIFKFARHRGEGGGGGTKSHQIAVRNFDFLRWFFLPYFFSSRVPRELFFKNYSLFERQENAFTAVKA
jgi:hypothetical protein